MPERPNQRDPPTLDETRTRLAIRPPSQATVFRAAECNATIAARRTPAGTSQRCITALGAFLALALFAGGQARAQSNSSMNVNSLAAQGNATVGGTLAVTGNTRLGANTQIGTSGNYLAINPNPSPAGNTYVNVGGTGALWVTPPIGGWWFTPNYTYTSASSTNPMLYFNGTANGSAPANSQLFTKFGCNDSVDYVTNGGAQAAGNCLWVIDNLDAGWTGQRLGLQSAVNVLAPSTTTGFVSAAAFNASSAHNMGGTNAQAAGYLTAYQYDAEAYSGATYLVMLEGWEGSTIVHPGASVGYVNGGKITVSGCTIPTASCNGLAIVGTGAQSASARIGLSFGSAEAPTFGVAPTGTLIGSQAYVRGNTLSAAYGVDFSGVTFSTGAFKSKGFLVDGSGRVSTAGLRLAPAAPSRSSAPCTPGQIAVDNSYVYVCTGPNAWKRAALASW